ncbi:DUF1127 domain-containing protein [Yoonia sp. 2307UL14-13]|uniref:DUF1127 domain-containing protein n=1 Tax=Yoonia sp. 2307UL14-13 TaxID=3126506 RepID=UPI0030B3E896
MPHAIQTSTTCGCTTTARPSGLMPRLFAFLALNRQRRTLKDLDDHMLRDIGVTREEADIESKRQVWDVPDHWR